MQPQVPKQVLDCRFLALLQVEKFTAVLENMYTQNNTVVLYSQIQVVILKTCSLGVVSVASLCLLAASQTYSVQIMWQRNAAM